MIQLEGSEDVDILDRLGNLVEAVQVKALAGNVTASSLRSEDDSFYRRADARLVAHPRAIQKVVSFGPFGPELAGAQKKGSPQRARLKAYIQKTGLKDKQVERVMNALRLEEVEENGLTTAVMQRLKETIAGADPEVAFTFLSGWLFLAMEEKARITAKDLERRLVAVGEFITQEALKRHEWNVNIVPLGELSVNLVDRARLSDEFYQGTYTRYEHIVADLDVRRDRKLTQIDEAFTRKNAVVVHGASGQGKTSLAYRYMRDRAVGFCVEVRVLDDALHALQVARVLASHAKAMGTRMVAYVDVAPRNLNWRSLVRELAGISHLRLLVTVREEDWARARSEGMQFEVADVALGFDELEARGLFDALVQKNPPKLVLDFEEAWAKFGGCGPLMEFSYLVTQSEALRERLAEQVRCLREEVRTSHEAPLIGKVRKKELELLRRVVVASGYGARLLLERLDEELDLPDLGATLALFEREYLLRRSNDGRYLEGLHPIRSQILAELLTMDEPIATWARTACACIRAIHEDDLSRFLLHSFSRREQDSKELLSALIGHQPETWIGVAGIFRALLWLGVRDYMRACRPLIYDVTQRFGSSFWILLGLDPAGVMDRWPELLPRWEEMEWIREDVRLALPQLRGRIPDKTIVSEHARRWLMARGPLSSPKTKSDWACAAEVTFWIGHWGIYHETRAKLTPDQVRGALGALPLAVAADVSLAVSFVEGEDFDRVESCRDELLERFRQELLVPAVEDDSRTVKAHFVLQMQSSDHAGKTGSNGDKRTKNPVHAETMRRIEILRGLRPTRAIYGSQGYGHKIDLLGINDDESVKNIPSANLPPRWLPSINGTLTELVDLELRPDSWDEYAVAAFALRRGVVDHLRQLREELQRYFRRRDSGDTLGFQPGAKNLEEMRRRASGKPNLPRIAVDEWGLTRSERDNVVDIEIASETQRQERYTSFQKSFKEYISSLSNFYSQAQAPIAINARFGRMTDSRQREAFKQAAWKAVGADERDNGLSTHNLHDAMGRLPRFQRMFRERFSAYFKVDELSLLESQERDELLKLWCVWYQFAHHPSKVTASILKESIDAFERPCTEARRRLKKHFKRFEAQGCRGSILSETVWWEDKRSIWIKMDVDNPLSIHQFLGAVLQVLHEAIPQADNAGSMARYSYDYFWNQIQLVPLFRGRAVDREMWHFSWLMLPRPDDDQQSLGLKLCPREIPEITWNGLGLQLWTFDRLELGRRFKGAFFELFLLLEHMLCLRNLPELDALGQEIVGKYGEKQAGAILEARRKLEEAASGMFEYAEALGPECLANRPLLAEVRQILPELWRQLEVEQRTGEEQTEVELLQAWCERLKAAAPMVEAVRLAWIGDVLDAEANLPQGARRLEVHGG
ncbi:hypothetical protein ACMHYB_56820 [Sorangium sp. So ce1128]